MTSELTDLPINDRGAVYHLDLRPEEVAETIITVGDPFRVGQVSQYFDKVEIKRSYREFTSHTGILNGKRMTVLSTGIGLSNVDIVLNELDALVNVDLDSRQRKTSHTCLNIIRIGTTGALQSAIHPGDVVMSQYGIGFDTLMAFYDWQDEPQAMAAALRDHLQGQLSSFFVAAASPALHQQFAPIATTGITVSCSGFYGPQGRQVRAPARFPNMVSLLNEFHYDNLAILNMEMETAGLYALSSLLGHNCVSLSVVLANRLEHSFTTDAQGQIDRLIQTVLAGL